MKVINSEYIIPCDVDDTLVMHGDKTQDTADISAVIEYVKIKDPINRGHFIVLRKNLPMIRILREEKHRGAYVIVWSRGGYEWAHNVVVALGLQDCVDQIMSKPKSYFDDKNVEEWLTDRVYLGPNVSYK